jgi:predicted dehydrogenase
VASRDSAKAERFKGEYNSVKSYGSYETLADDPDIDIVYVATPHVFHFENTMMCLEKGKSVLCEKPMGMNSEQVQAMVKEAQRRNLFLMEGIWTRFIPATEKLLEILDEKTIGDLVSVRADFGFKGEFDLNSRLYNKKLGAGSLLDIGIYPVYLSLITLGQPKKIKAVARLTKTDVDSYCAMLFDYQNGSKASLESTIEADTPIEGYIYGSKGSIKMHSRFHHTEILTISVNGKSETLEMKIEGNGYLYEIEEANQCLANNQTESEKLPLSTSIDLMSVLKMVMEEIGLNYEGYISNP